MARKRALLVGCNYPGTDSELSGCVNDVDNMYAVLVNRFGFTPDDIIVMVDTNDAFLSPTGANIRWALRSLVSLSQPGDVIFFLYSGHGTRLPADDGEDDDTGFDECIVPTDLNFIDDDDIREFVEKLPPDVKLTIVSDSCHSGGLIDRAKEQIGDSFLQAGADAAEEVDSVNAPECDANVKPKSLRLDDLLRALTQKKKQKKSGGEEEEAEEEEEEVKVGNIRATLFDLFGDTVSSKVKRFVTALRSELGAGDDDAHASSKQEAQDENEATEDEDDGASQDQDQDHEAESVTIISEKSGRINDREDQDEVIRDQMGVLVSGCQSYQLSTDVGSGGACCNAIVAVLESTPPDQILTNRELVIRVREHLAAEGFAQQPGLYCSDENADAPFIC